MSDSVLPRVHVKRLGESEKNYSSRTKSLVKRKNNKKRKPLHISITMAEQASNSGLAVTVSAAGRSSTDLNNSHDCVDLTNDSLIDLTELTEQQSPISLRFSQSQHSPDFIQRPSCRYSTTSSAAPLSSNSQQDVVFVCETKNDVVFLNSPSLSSDSSLSLRQERKKKKLTSPSPPDALEIITHEESKPSHEDSKTLTCPICLESPTQFRTKGSKLVTTICGHVFCSTCIRNAISTMHKCPSCRKKLTLKQYHQLYL